MSDPSQEKPGKPAPENTVWHQFAQQRLKAFQPLLAPKAVISIYIVCGFLFSGMGFGFLMISRSVVEYSRDYSDIGVDEVTGTNHFDLHVKDNMEPPIWVNYELQGFHQNHRRYIKSRPFSQFKDTTPILESSKLKECSPWITTNADDDDRVNYPCGLIARSVFNDTYLLQVKEENGAPWQLLAVESNAKDIAWEADRDGKFKNLDPEARTGYLENQEQLNMWINQRYPPVECRQVFVSDEKPFIPVYPAMRRQTVPASGGRTAKTVEVVDCQGYLNREFGQVPECNYVRQGQHFTCEGDYKPVVVRDWGIESGHFIVWMRIAGLPVFRKLWGRIDKPLKAGSTLRVHFAHHFPVREFFGRKAFVISTSSVLGGRNDCLGIGYIVVGCFCLVLPLASCGNI